MALGGMAGTNTWFTLDYARQHTDVLLSKLSEHVTLTLTAVALGTVISLPLALLARRGPRVQALVLGTEGVLYSIPSIALVTLLVPLNHYGLGLSKNSVVVMLTVYTLLIVTRNAVAGLQGVPPEVVEAATGMGYGRLTRLLRVELPLALPVLVAGIRIATVSTVALVTIGAFVGYGGLGSLILEGFSSGTADKPKIMTAMVLCVALAVVADLALVAVLRLVSPWQRGSRR